MDRGSKLTLAGLIVVSGVILFIVAIAIPGLRLVERMATHVVCGTNLKGIGVGLDVYARDFEGAYPKLGQGVWSKDLGFAFDDSNYDAPHHKGDCTITSSLYLLIRQADVAPKTFVSPHSKDQPFDEQARNNKNFVQLWDFGTNPYKHVSYSFHNPYGSYPANNSRSAAFAVMSDMNPWFKNGDIISPGKDNGPPQIIRLPNEPFNLSQQQLDAIWKPANSVNEIFDAGFFWKKQMYGEGQNVLFADGHVSYETQPNVAMKYDNIYTFWSVEENPTEQDIQGGTPPTSRSPENDAKSKSDSFLAI